MRELEEGKQFPFVRNVEGFVGLVSAVTGDNVGYLIDTWDWCIGDGAMDQLSELPGDKIVAVRIASLPDDVDTSKATSEDRALPEMGGALDHVKIINHLNSLGFDGPVSPGASSSRYRGTTRESIVQRAQEAIVRRNRVPGDDSPETRSCLADSS